MKKILLSLCILCLIYNGNTYAQLQLEVVTAPKELYANEPFTLQFTIKGTTHIRQFRQPTHENMRYIGGPFQSASEHKINGKVSREFSVSFTVVINQPGKFTLPPAMVRTEEDVQSFPELKLNILSGRRLNTSNSRKPANPFQSEEEWPTDRKALEQKIRNEVFIRLETDKTTCYNGEPLIAEYKLYSRLKCDSKLTRNPSFNGFSVTDIPQENEGEEKTDTIDGKEYNVYTIRKVQLIPLQTGTLTIENAVLENNVYLIPQGVSLDPFDPNYDPFLTNVKVHRVQLTSNEATVKVLPLPAHPPAGFNGAVGDFTFNATLMQYVFPVQKEGKLVLEVQGSGNLQLLTPPAIEWPEELEPLEAVIQDDVGLTAENISGSRRFIIPFLVRTPGEYTLPAASFTVFNPVKKNYETLTAPALEMHVLAATDEPNPIATTANTSLSRNVLFILSGTALLLLVTVAFVLFRRKKSKIKSAPVSIADAEAPQVVTPEPEDIFTQSRLALQPGNEHAFYKSLHQEFKHHLCTKLHLPLYTDTATIANTLDKQGVPETLHQATVQLLQELEMNMYAPITPAHQPADVLDRAMELTTSLRFYFRQV